MIILKLYQDNSLCIEQARKTLKLLDNRSKEPLSKETFELLLNSQEKVRRILREAENELNSMLDNMPNSIIQDAFETT